MKGPFGLDTSERIEVKQVSRSRCARSGPSVSLAARFGAGRR